MYLLWDSQRKANLSYAFLNFVDHESAMIFFFSISGGMWERTQKTCRVATAFVQGLAENLAKYFAESGIQEGHPHPPMVFHNGRRVELTQAVRQFCAAEMLNRAAQLVTRDNTRRAAELATREYTRGQISKHAKSVGRPVPQEAASRNHMMPQFSTVAPSLASPVYQPVAPSAFSIPLPFGQSSKFGGGLHPGSDGLRGGPWAEETPASFADEVWRGEAGGLSRPMTVGLQPIGKTISALEVRIDRDVREEVVGSETAGRGAPDAQQESQLKVELLQALRETCWPHGQQCVAPLSPSLAAIADMLKDATQQEAASRDQMISQFSTYAPSLAAHDADTTRMQNFGRSDNSPSLSDVSQPVAASAKFDRAVGLFKPDKQGLEGDSLEEVAPACFAVAMGRLLTNSGEVRRGEAGGFNLPMTVGLQPSRNVEVRF